MRVQRQCEGIEAEGGTGGGGWAPPFPCKSLGYRPSIVLLATTVPDNPPPPIKIIIPQLPPPNAFLNPQHGWAISGVGMERGGGLRGLEPLHNF